MKCKGCGSTDIDVDPARGDSVCTNCGLVLETGIIVSDIQFEENAHGGASAIGQFVSSDSKGGGNFGGGGKMGGGGGYGQLTNALGRESRETTLRNARKKIEALAHQLSLRRDRIDMAFQFYKLALARNLTRGRKHTHIIAACLYITCRTEGTSHMLIDFSDILQIDVYELGRTYLRLSQALCINIPAMDPCLYVMRFAHKLELGEKTHEVSMTALRLVSRMKKDWIHFGRRPSGLCGAALLIASRLYDFNRSIDDIVKIVKLHESTVRKRLNEFGATTTALLTIDEFSNVDLETMTEEEDPPSFKAARKKDKERLQKLEKCGVLDKELSELEQKIEGELEKLRSKQLRSGSQKKAVRVSEDSRSDSEEVRESRETDAFIAQETFETINEIVGESDRNLMPPPSSSSSKFAEAPGLGLKSSIQEYLMPVKNDSACDDKSSHRDAKTSHHHHHHHHRRHEPLEEENEELDLTGIDDNEIDGYIMNEKEVEYKTIMWMRVNSDYLKEKAAKEERERLEREEAEKEGKPVKKRNSYKKKPKPEKGQNQTVIEAIEKIVQEKKISTKINYDVLKSLGAPVNPKSNDNEMSSRLGLGGESIFGQSPIASPANASSVFSPAASTSNFLSPAVLPTVSPKKESQSKSDDAKKKTTSADKVDPPVKRQKLDGPPEEELPDAPKVIVEEGPVVPEPTDEDHLDEEDDFDEDEEGILSASQLLRQHRANEFEEEEFDDEYY